MDYSILRDRSPSVLGKMRESAVMVLIVKKDEGYNIDPDEDSVIFEKRALKLKSQPGDICFPGGRVEENEEPMNTALRETCEELGISENEIEILGPLDYLVTPKRNIIYPFAGIYRGSEFNISRDEVEEVIRIPLADLLDQEPLVHKVRVEQLPDENFPYDRIVGGRNYPFYTGENPQVFYYLGSETVWGVTAAILKNFMEIITGNQ